MKIPKDLVSQKLKKPTMAFLPESDLAMDFYNKVVSGNGDIDWKGLDYLTKFYNIDCLTVSELHELLPAIRRIYNKFNEEQREEHEKKMESQRNQQKNGSGRGQKMPPRPSRSQGRG